MNKYLRYAAILRKSREMIAADTHSCICYTLPVTEDGRLVRRWIKRQLCLYAFYEDWVFHNFKIELTAGQAREGRLQWLDHMIKLCEKWGRE